MLKHVLYASAALALLAAPSLAVDGSIAVTGTVKSACNMAYTTAPVAIGDIKIDSNTAVNTAQTATGLAQAGTTFCNTNSAEMSITVPVLTGSVAPANGQTGVQFTNLIPYTVTLPGGDTLHSSTDATPAVYNKNVGTFVQNVPANSVVTINTLAAAGPVVAGTYSATITITLTP
jgi:hypothetical protein